MFKAIRQRIRDAGTIKSLCFAAEKHANARGQGEPGAEHFVLAALELPDGTARQAFAQLQRNPDDFGSAIEAQYRSALRSIGLDMPAETQLDATGSALPATNGPYRTQPSAQGLMQVLTREIMVPEQKRDSAAPLVGAHVLLAASRSRHGVCARALQAMGISPEALAEAARQVIDRGRLVRAG